MWIQKPLKIIIIIIKRPSMISNLPLKFPTLKVQGTSGSNPKTGTKTHDDVSKFA